MKDIYEMELHEKQIIEDNQNGHCGVIRVPGGWIYTITIEYNRVSSANSVFVPYADSARFIKNGSIDRISELEKEISVDEKILKRYDALLAMIPECPDHGGGCIPHAVDWIENAKERLDGMPDE